MCTLRQHFSSDRVLFLICVVEYVLGANAALGEDAKSTVMEFNRLNWLFFRYFVRSASVLFMSSISDSMSPMPQISRLNSPPPRLAAYGVDAVNAIGVGDVASTAKEGARRPRRLPAAATAAPPVHQHLSDEQRSRPIQAQGA